MTLSQKSIDEAILPFYSTWVELSNDIENCFKSGTEDCRPLIAKGWMLYEELKQVLHELFGSEAPSPLNESERLAFVRNSRSAHAASRQLEQLYRELKKKIARAKIGYSAN